MSRKTIEGETFDKTALHASGYGYAVHRDFAAHFFRWGLVTKVVVPGMSILEIGCGTDTPLARVFTYKHIRPAKYVGTDLNKLSRVPSRQWAEFIGEFDFTRRAGDLKKKHGTFDLIVSFEVIEHMPVEAGRRLLKNARELMGPNSLFMLSTPAFNGKAAKNHIHEYRIDELEKEIKAAKLKVEKRYGTFASYHDIKKVATKEERAVLDRIREYYDGEVAACFLAPLYPDNSRNNVWYLRRA